MPKNHPNSKNNQKPKSRLNLIQQDCQLGWNCPEILHNNCKFKHNPNDRQDIQSLNRILKNKNKIIIISDTYYKDIKPVCLFEIYLPIKLLPNPLIKIETGKYYVGSMVAVETSSLLIRLDHCLGNFGDWKIERKIHSDHLPDLFDKCEPNEEFKKKRGMIKVNSALVKVLEGQQKLREYYRKVNQKFIYPLLDGCKVAYYEKNRKIYLQKIEYPPRLKLSGILQIDRFSQFYFIARSPTIDQMNPYRLPDQLITHLQQLTHTLPYTMFKKDQLKKQIQNSINQILKTFLIKGSFQEWPQQSSYPIISLEDQIDIRNFLSEKHGIIYETGLSMKSFSNKEKKQSEKIAKTLDIKKLLNKRKLFDKNVFTIDSKNTKCHDDAIMIKKQQNLFQVQIHIADVAAVIKPSSSLDQTIKERDSTMYIKDYFKPMIHDSLRNKLSLRSGQQKLALTMSFRLSFDGQIDFGSVRFFNSIIKVEKNLSHQRLQKGQQDYPQLFEVSACLEKSQIMKQRSLIESQLRSEMSMSRLIELSAIIPTVMFELNFQKCRQFRIKFNNYLNKIIQLKQTQMQLWQSQVDKINKVQSVIKSIEKQKKLSQKQMTKDLNRQKTALMNKIKESIKANKTKQNNQNLQKISKTKNQQQQQDQQENLSGDETYYENSQNDDQKQNNKQEQFDEEGLLNQQIQNVQIANEILMKQKRTKAIKGLKENQNLIQISSQDQYSDSQNDDQLVLGDGYRMSKALAGKTYMTNIFRHFQITVQWLHQSDINSAFRKILSLNHGKLYQEYFKRMQIMNRQHFPYIVKAARKQAKIQDITQKRSQKTSGLKQTLESVNIKERRVKRQKKQMIPSQNQHKSLDKNSQKEPLSQQNNQKQPLTGKPRYPKKARQRQDKRTINKKSPKLQKIQEEQQQLQKSESKYQQLQSQHSQVNQFGLQQNKFKNKRKENLYKQNNKNKDQLCQNKKIYLLKENQQQKITTQLEEDVSALDQANTQLNTLTQFQVRLTQKIQISGPANSDCQIQTKPESIVEQETEPECIAKQKNKPERIAKQKNKPERIAKQKNKPERIIEQENKSERIVEQGNKSERIVEQENKSERIIEQENKSERIIEQEKKSERIIEQENKSERIIEQENKSERIVEQENKSERFVEQETEPEPIVEQKTKPKRIAKQKNKLERIAKQQNKPERIVEQETKPERIFEQKTEPERIFEQKTKFEQIDNKDPSLKLNSGHDKKMVDEETKVQGNQKEQGFSKDKESKEQQESSVQQNEEHKKQQEQALTQKPEDKRKVAGCKGNKKINQQKKQLKKMVEQLLNPIREQIKLKYSQKLSQLNEQLKKLKEQQSNVGKTLRQELQKQKIHFNLIELAACDVELARNINENKQQSDDDGGCSEEERENKKKKKKSNKNQKKKKKQSTNPLLKIVEALESYASKSKYTFPTIQDKELNQYLVKQLDLEELMNPMTKQQNLNKINEQVIRVMSQKNILKWNNPIRSYKSLMVMRVIKDYVWLFQGKIYPTEIIQFGNQIRQAETMMKRIEAYQQDKIVNGQNDKKVRQANRQIDYLKFYYQLKKQPEQVHTFLNITSPIPKIKRVFHEVLGEVDLENTKIHQQLYKEVKGKVKIVQDFPIKLKVEIIQQ